MVPDWPDVYALKAMVKHAAPLVRLEPSTSDPLLDSDTRSSNALMRGKLQCLKLSAELGQTASHVMCASLFVVSCLRLVENHNEAFVPPDAPLVYCYLFMSGIAVKALF